MMQSVDCKHCTLIELNHPKRQKEKEREGEGRGAIFLQVCSIKSVLSMIKFPILL